jgi:TRAP-type C4-dicarboxylate transport system substrate-binding protein
MMRKGLFVALVGVFSVSLFILLLTPTALFAEPIKLNYANFPPAPTFPCVQMEQWKKEVEKRTGGKVAINTFPGGTLLNAKNMFDGVIAGTADIGCLCMAYQPGRFMVTNATALPLGAPNAKVGSLVLWDIYKKYKPEAFAEVKVLTMFNTYPGNILSKKPVRTLEDIKGMELRGSGPAVAALKAWGATPVGMPMPQTVEALQKGVVQGLFSSGEVMKDFKFAEYCKYVTLTKRVMYPFSVVMNMDVWKKLPADVQKVMDDMSVEHAVWVGEYLDKHVFDAFEWSKKNHNVEIIELSAEQMAEWDKLLEPVVQKWADDAKAKGLPAEEILEEIKALTKKYAGS